MAGVLRLQLSCLQPDGLEVRVLESPAGEPHGVLTRPFDSLQTQAVLKLLETADAGRLVPDELAAAQAIGLVDGSGLLLGPEQRNRQIGRRLYDALFPGSRDPDANVQGAFSATLNEARQTGQPAALQLRFDSDAVGLAGLPWELICDPAGQAPVAEGWVSLTRYITFGQTVAPLPVSDCLEVLVVAPRPKDAPPLGGDRERLAIQNAFRELNAGPRLRVEPLDPPTFDALVARINARPYHVVHFDGHGDFAARCPYCSQFRAASQPACRNQACPAYGRPDAQPHPEGCLVFERGENDHSTYFVSANDLATVLANRQVHLFVASACQSGAVGGDSVFTGVGPRLILAGVPAVVAMQFSVPAGPTARFVAEFYAALARGDSVASAAGAGRKMLYTSGIWFIPAVYLRSRDGEGYLYRYQPWAYVPASDLREAQRAARPRDAAPYKFLSAYEIRDEPVFFGREDETRRLLEEALARSPVVLLGPPGVGKTSLLNAGLSPALLKRGLVVLTVREYTGGDPAAQVRRAIAATPALSVDPGPAGDLREAVGDVMRATGRPVAVIFDAFERFLAEAQPGQREAFAAQMAACTASFDLGRCCLVLAVREDWAGSLPRLLPGLPDLLKAVLPLGLLNREQARSAITGPLEQHDPPMQYSPSFLDDSLLPELLDPKEGTVNPTHLQIICQELYNRARAAHASTIDARLCPEGGAKEILRDYLNNALDRLPPAQRELGRALMKPMVSPAGERVFLSLHDLADRTGARPEDAQAVLDALLGDGLLDPRTAPDGILTYSLGHSLLAKEVQGWFDRQEAQRRWAENDLKHAWDGWYAEWLVAPDRAAAAPLASPDQLREIQAARHAIEITPAQFCLLLRSALRAGYDADYWTSQFAACKEARDLAFGIETGLRPGAGWQERQAVETGAGALGLGPGFVGNHGLARGAIAAADASVRHASALALGALGMEAVDRAIETLLTGRPAGRGYRGPKALAQMAVAGLRLPPLPMGLGVRVSAWQAGIRLWDGRWRLAAEASGAALGGGVLLLLLMALIYLPVAMNPSLPSRDFVVATVAFYLLLGGMAGLFFAAGRWCLDVLAPRRAARLLGGGIGFSLAFLALWPVMSPGQRQVLLPQAALGLAAGAAIALGLEVEPGPARWPRAALGGAAGGASVFGAAWLLGVPLPLQVAPGASQFLGLTPGAVLQGVVLVLAVLTGAVVGAGLTGGEAAGSAAYRRYVDLTHERGAAMPGSEGRVT